jgi:hypothetical protein
MSGPDRDAGGPPAEALGDVWNLLDELPREAASERLTATTVEMAAVSASGRAAAGGLRAWLVPGAVVVAALVAGIVAGRATAPEADARSLAHLPLVMHLDLLREAGAVRFLEAVTGRGGPPLRMLLRQGPEAARRRAGECRAEIEELAALWSEEGGPAEVAARRRDVVAGLSLEDRVEFERATREWARLSAAERKALAAVATALADPSRPELREAAVAWHQWLQAMRPEDRADLVAAGTDDRLAWIDWYAARRDERGPPRRPSGRPPPR